MWVCLLPLTYRLSTFYTVIFRDSLVPVHSLSCCDDFLFISHLFVGNGDLKRGSQRAHMGQTEEDSPLFRGNSYNSDEDDDISIVDSVSASKRLSSRRCLVYGLILQLLLIAFYTAVSFTVIRKALETDSDPNIPGRHSL